MKTIIGIMFSLILSIAFTAWRMTPGTEGQDRTVSFAEFESVAEQCKDDASPARCQAHLLNKMMAKD